MLEHTHDPQAVARSVRLYRRLVSAYPADFRREYGEPMLQVFRDSCLRAILEGGSQALIALWIRTSYDYFKSIIEEYARGGTEMTCEKFFKLSGWALMLAAVVFVAGVSIGGGEKYYDDPLGGPDGFYEYGQLILIPVAMLLYAVGMTGLLARYGGISGSLGKTGLVIAVIGSVLSFFSAIPLYALMTPWLGEWWYFMIYSMLAMLVGLSLFGLIALRTKPLIRWNALPLLTAIWFPLVFIIGWMLELSGISTNGIDGYMAFAALLFLFVGSIVLGYILQKDIPAVTPGSPLQA